MPDVILLPLAQLQVTRDLAYRDELRRFSGAEQLRASIAR